MKQKEKILDTEEIAELLKVSRQKISNLIDEGMPKILIGKVYRFDKDEVIDWLKSRSGDKFEEQV